MAAPHPRRLPTAQSVEDYEALLALELLAGFCSCFLKINPVLAGGVYGALTKRLCKYNQSTISPSGR
ncbi:hypothetical protein N5J10_17445 [Pseudomonas oleovorans]|nr:hypothetical protein [Pseudomonas oleovorans]MDH1494126.1 hypothetical protein [Pseudomonas oleovorans]